MNKIDVSSISFDELRESFINFAKSKEQYSDWEFGGSNISFLVDMLTYSTYYNTVYHSMMLNETFLDTATQRSSVVARAKEHGYIPKSRSSAYINATISFDAAGITEDGLPLPTSITIPKGTQLSIKINDIIYTFNTTRTYVVYNLLGVYELSNVMFYEGHLTSNIYTYYLNPEITVPTMADMTTLEVYVDGEEWTYAKNAIQYTPESKVYYYYENGVGEYSVYFGDGIISAKPAQNAQIQVSYLQSAGPDANAGLGVYEVSLNDTFSEDGIDYTKYVRIETSIPTGGSNRETIEEIRKGTIRRSIAQNRAVTVRDFIYIVENEFYNEVLRCNAWDINTITDNIDPLDLGKVYICIQPRDYRTNPYIGFISEDSIYRTLTSQYTLGGIRVEIVDPIYIKINHSFAVYYNKNLLDVDLNTIKSRITNNVKALYDSDIIKFDNYLPISRIQSEADAADRSIVSTSLSITCTMDIPVEESVDLNRYIQFKNEVVPGTITSNIYDITDEEVGLVGGDLIGNLVSSTIGNVGTINYTKGTGTVIINGSNILEDGAISFNFRVATPHVKVSKEFILIDSDVYEWNFIEVNEGVL